MEARTCCAGPWHPRRPGGRGDERRVRRPARHHLGDKVMAPEIAGVGRRVGADCSFPRTCRHRPHASDRASAWEPLRRLPPYRSPRACRHRPHASDRASATRGQVCERKTELFPGACGAFRTPKSFLQGSKGPKFLLYFASTARILPIAGLRESPRRQSLWRHWPCSAAKRPAAEPTETSSSGVVSWHR